MTDEPTTDLTPVDDKTPQVDALPDLAAVRDAISSASADLAALAEAGDWESILMGIAVLDTIRRELSILRSTAGGIAAELMPDKEYLVPGVGLWERRSTAKRVTDWDAILNAIQNRALVDTKTGEVIEDPRIAVDRMYRLIKAIVPLYRSTAAKQGGLSEAGIDKEAVQDTSWGRADVTFKAPGR